MSGVVGPASHGSSSRARDAMHAGRSGNHTLLWVGLRSSAVRVRVGFTEPQSQTPPRACLRGTRRSPRWTTAATPHIMQGGRRKEGKSGLDWACSPHRTHRSDQQNEMEPSLSCVISGAVAEQVSGGVGGLSSYLPQRPRNRCSLLTFSPAPMLPFRLGSTWTSRAQSLGNVLYPSKS